MDGLNLQAAADDAQIWEKALRKLRGHLMPPPGSPQPPQKDVDSFVAWMENTLDTPIAKGPKAGYVPIQRLNRTEYAASVKALVGVDVNAKDVLPQDIQVEGFDNIAAALSVSPAFLDQYVTAARQVAKLAVGSPNPRVSSVKYSIAANQNPDEPLPLGTRGGMKFKHNFPADGEYRITINDLGGRPVHRRTGEREHAGHHDRRQDRVPQAASAGRRIWLWPIARAPTDARRSWSASRRFPCRWKPACTTSWWPSSTVRMWSPTTMSRTQRASAA